MRTEKNKSETTRIGVVVSTAVHKTAVKRNFWKRQARTALSELAKNFSEPQDLLLVLFPSVTKLAGKDFRAMVLASGAELAR